MTERWMTVAEAAKRLGVSGQTVRRLIRGGAISGVKKTVVAGNSPFLVSVASVEAYEQRREARPA